MFFFKKSSPSDENVAKKSVKKVDALVTGVILGGVIASLYGVKKIRENNEQKGEIVPEEKRKKSILKRIIFGNK
ncbi:hypothetical protein KBB25_02925 [Candidatus Gracilibacteria bacterium]|nr:hypothetical protein [Candidatus Gracilibacteria bacterium]